jgi:hypothetical protein
MQKVPGVATVKVSLNDGLTILDLKPQNTVTLANLRQVIRNNGFVTKEIELTARGSLQTLSGQPTFVVAGTNERLALSPQLKVTAVDVP